MYVYNNNGSVVAVTTTAGLATQTISVDNSGMSAKNFLSTAENVGMGIASPLALGAKVALTSFSSGNGTVNSNFNNPVILYNTNLGTSVSLNGSTATFVDSDGNPTVIESTQFQQMMQNGTAGDYLNWVGSSVGKAQAIIGKLMPVAVNSQNVGSAVITAWSKSQNP